MNSDIFYVERAAEAHTTMRGICESCEAHDLCDGCPVEHGLRFMLGQIHAHLDPALLYAALNEEQARAVMIVERQLRVVQGGKRKRRARGPGPWGPPQGA